jgi:hypothetical protein
LQLHRLAQEFGIDSMAKTDENNLFVLQESFPIASFEACDLTDPSKRLKGLEGEIRRLKDPDSYHNLPLTFAITCDSATIQSNALLILIASSRMTRM